MFTGRSRPLCWTQCGCESVVESEWEAAGVVLEGGAHPAGLPQSLHCAAARCCLLATWPQRAVYCCAAYWGGGPCQPSGCRIYWWHAQNDDGLPLAYISLHLNTDIVAMWSMKSFSLFVCMNWSNILSILPKLAIVAADNCMLITIRHLSRLLSRLLYDKSNLAPNLAPIS